MENPFTLLLIVNQAGKHDPTPIWKNRTANSRVLALGACATNKPGMTMNLNSKSCSSEKFREYDFQISRTWALITLKQLAFMAAVNFNSAKLFQILKEDDYILQTKGVPENDPHLFRSNLEDAFRRFKRTDLTLFGVHGINLPEHLDKTLKPGGCMDVLKEYQAKGKIGHIGFSTHGSNALIKTSYLQRRFRLR